MKLILQEQVPNLGGPGDEVDVAPGFGRNYLLPKGLAVKATEANRNLVFQRKKKMEEKAAADLEASKALAESLASVSVNIKRRVADGETLYGSVSPADIVEALAVEGFEINKDDVRLEHHIKALGIYEVPIHLPYGVEASIKVWVIREDDD
jgi:large subunit ribosomal protein L9